LAHVIFRNPLFTNKGVGRNHFKFEHFFHLLLFLFTNEIGVIWKNVKKELIDLFSRENAKIILVFHIHVIQVLRQDKKLRNFKDMLLDFNFCDSWIS
jgi:hypothetical protein